MNDYLIRGESELFLPHEAAAGHRASMVFVTEAFDRFYGCPALILPTIHPPS
jgi:hypothetical protein